MPDALTSRWNMVDSQVRTADVTDLRLIEAMRATPREAFLPESQKALAYLDRDIALDGEDNVYLIKPMVLGRLLQAADIEPTDRVLVTGGAAGYAAALAGRLGAEVVAVCANDKVAAASRSALEASGLSNITVTAGEAGQGDAAGGLTTSSCSMARPRWFRRPSMTRSSPADASSACSRNLCPRAPPS
ncbi:hypothetical protein CRBSH125_00220 [Afipia carboxidovorans]|nr:hypothetical protein CRBSH125_00220 [Afipia carboxidovorans]